MAGFYGFSQVMLACFFPILIVALGGLISERSGVMNIALDGLMIIGGWVGIIVMDYMFVAMGVNDSVQSMTNMQIDSALVWQKIVVYLVAASAAGLTGMVFSLIHAYSSITLNANQAISGTAINLLAPALCLFLNMALDIGGYKASGKSVSEQLPSSPVALKFERIPGLSNIPVIGDIFFKNFYLTGFLGIIILFVVWFVLYKTKFGKHLRGCGDNPYAVASCGVNVRKMRYIAVMISGFLAGIGGFGILIPNSVVFSGQVFGYGFLALAVLIFGAWKPFRIFFAALFFSFFVSLANGVDFFPFLSGIKIDSNVYNLLPYIFTLGVLALSASKARAPEAVAKPYYPRQK